MSPLTEREIRAAFVNCSKGEASRLNLPADLAEVPWADLDYLGWRDPKAPQRGFLVAPLADGPCGVAMRAPAATVGGARKAMCSLCLTVRSGNVSLMVAPRAGKAGKDGNTVGTYICADLECSLYVRGKRHTGGPGVQETLTVDERVSRLQTNLESFVARVRS